MDNLSPISPQREQIQLQRVDDGKVKQPTINIDTLSLKEKDSAIRVFNFVMGNVGLLTQDPEKATKLSQRIEGQIREIKQNTSGVLNSIYYFFHRSEKAELDRQLDAFTKANELLKGVKEAGQFVKAQPKAEPQPQARDIKERERKRERETVVEHEEFVPEAQIGSDLLDVDVLQDTGAAIQRDKEIEVPRPKIKVEANKEEKEGFEPPIPQPLPQTNNVEGQEEGPPPPPPLPGTEGEGGIPPPPPMGLPGPKKVVKQEPTIEELTQKHNEDEDKRLADEAQRRADPDSYSDFTPPDDKTLKDLERQEKGLVADIALYERILKQNKDVPLQDALNEKQAKLEEVRTEKKGTPKLLRSATDPGFPERLAALTTEELKVIIGMYFKGQRPAKETPDYKLYVPSTIPPKEQEKAYDTANRVKSEQKSQATQRALDNIFQNWQELSTSQVGQSFLKNREQWEKYLPISRTAFIETLVKRTMTEDAAKQGKPLDPKDENYAKAPVHARQPFVPPKKREVGKKPPTTTQPSEDGKAAHLGAIQKGIALKKAADRKIEPKKEEKEEIKKPRNPNEELFKAITSKEGPKLRPTPSQASGKTTQPKDELARHWEKDGKPRQSIQNLEAQQEAKLRDLGKKALQDKEAQGGKLGSRFKKDTTTEETKE